MLNHIGTQTLETERLILRKFEISDADDMFNNWANDDRVTKYLSWPTHSNVEITKALMQEWATTYDKETYNWAIVNKCSNSVIGSITVVAKSNQDEWAEIGYCIGRDYWGKGLTLEALKALIEFLIKKVGYNRIQAIHYEENKASGRVMQKAGMKYEGVKREYIKTKHGQHVNVESYAILKCDID